MEYFKFISLWVGWCFIHSYLIAPSVTRYLQKHLNNKYYYFRLFYNISAVISFILIRLYNPVLDERILFSWSGYLRVIQFSIFASSIALFISGARNYDMKQFLGIIQIALQKANKSISKSDKLNISGILKYTRHPWYLGGILFIWSDFNHLVVSSLIMKIILTLYLIIGTFLEERKLLTEFGDEYHKYQKNVSMLFPFKSFRNWY